MPHGHGRAAGASGVGIETQGVLTGFRTSLPRAPGALPAETPPKASVGSLPSPAGASRLSRVLVASTTHGSDTESAHVSPPPGQRSPARRPGQCPRPRNRSSAPPGHLPSCPHRVTAAPDGSWRASVPASRAGMFWSLGHKLGGSTSPPRGAGHTRPVAEGALTERRGTAEWGTSGRVSPLGVSRARAVTDLTPAPEGVEVVPQAHGHCAGPVSSRVHVPTAARGMGAGGSAQQ